MASSIRAELEELEQNRVVTATGVIENAMASRIAWRVDNDDMFFMIEEYRREVECQEWGVSDLFAEHHYVVEVQPPVFFKGMKAQPLFSCVSQSTAVTKLK